MSPSAYTDPFARDHLPPHELWPDLLLDPPFDYPERLNCAAELLDGAIARGHGERPLLHTDDGAWTYADVQDRVNRIARVLTEDMGMATGERVLLRGPNTPMLAACWLAVIKAGGICVATMPLLRAYELVYTVEKAQVRLALCDAAWLDEMERTQEQTSVLERILPFNTDDEDGLEERMAGKPAAFDAVDTAADDVALIAFTSGTTGEAKATAHFHRDVLAICDAFPRSCLDLSPEDVFTGSPPLAFTFGLGGILLFPMRVGASAVFVPKPSPEALLGAIEAHWRDGLRHLADGVPRDAVVPGRLRRQQPARVHLGGRAAPGADVPRVARGDGHLHHRRHRRDGDAAHLYLGARRRGPPRRDGQADPRLRGEGRGRARRGGRARHRRASGGTRADGLPLPWTTTTARGST